MALVLSGCGEPYLSALKPAGEVAQTQYDLMILSTVIMVGVIIVVVLFSYLLFLNLEEKMIQFQNK